MSWQKYVILNSELIPNYRKSTVFDYIYITCTVCQEDHQIPQLKTNNLKLLYCVKSFQSLKGIRRYWRLSLSQQSAAGLILSCTCWFTLCFENEWNTLHNGANEEKVKHTELWGKWKKHLNEWQEEEEAPKAWGMRIIILFLALHWEKLPYLLMSNIFEKTSRKNETPVFLFFTYFFFFKQCTD